jgi:hypothetical protein
LVLRNTMSLAPVPLIGAKPATCQSSPTAPNENGAVIWLLATS